MKKISIVVPVFNEEENIKEFYKRITSVFLDLKYDYEIIYVDDGSKDKSVIILNELIKQDSRVKAFLLSRNFGHQIAIICGIDNSTGDAVITMDGDLQHPPELIPELLKDWEDGYEIVQTIRKSTEDASIFKKITSAVYYKIINKISAVHITPGGSDFRLMDREVVEAFKLYKERARFIRGIINNLGFKTKKVEFVAPARFAGSSKFSLKKMMHFALDGITAFSNKPLRIAFYVGLILGFLSLLLLGHVLYSKYIAQDAVLGWTTLAVSVLFLGGIQLVGIGILGEYIGKVFEEVKQRPLYIVGKKLENKNLIEKNENYKVK